MEERERNRGLMEGEEDEFEHGGTETISVRMGRGHEADGEFMIDPISAGHNRSASLGNILDGAGEDDRQRDEAYLKEGCCTRTLKYGAMGRPATGYALVFVCMTLSIIPRAILIPIAPSIIKSAFGNDMCPNITAAHRATIPGSPGGGHTDGFKVQAEKESASGFTSAFAAPIAGYLSDKIGRRPVLIVSAIGMAVPLIALAVTCDTGYYVPLLVFSGAPSDTAFNTATFAFIADVIPPGRRGEAYGFIMLTFTIAALISAPLGAFLADLWAETHSIYLFRVCAGAALLPVAFACFFIAEPMRLGQALDEEEGNVGKKKHKKGFAGLRPLLLGPLGAYLFVNFLTSMESAGVSSLFMIYMTDAFPECGPECQSMQTMAFAICNAISNGLLLPLCVRILGSGRSLWLSMVANFIHCVIFAFAQKLWLVYANFIFSGLAMLGYSIMSDFISASVPPELVGSAMGASNSLYMLASVISPILHAALFIEWSNNPISHSWPGIPWLVGAGFILLALIALALTKNVRTDISEHGEKGEGLLDDVEEGGDNA